MKVILTQPFYENYWPDCALAGAIPRFVSAASSRAGGSTLDQLGQLRPSMTTPKRSSCAIRTIRLERFLREHDLEQVAGLCRKWNVIGVTDDNI